MRTRKHKSAQRRGVALILAVVAIAVLTAVATDFAYNQRVDLQLATNEREALQAHYLAESGIGMSRLLLRFQKQLDSIQLPNLAGILGQLGGGAQGAQGAGALAGLLGGAGGAGASMPTSMNLQLWKAAKIDCHLIAGLNPDGQPEKGGFGDISRGCFEVKISDEEEKLNLNQLDAPELLGRAAATRMMSLLGDPRFAFLYDDEDANHVKMSAQDTLIAIKDWIDDDSTQSSLNLTGDGEAFLPGFSDEASAYDRYTPRYDPKNARFDTLDELYMVAGVNDRFMAAFRDRLTVYPDINARLNINTDDPMMLYLAVLSVTDPVHPDPRLSNPVFVDELIKQIRQARMFDFLGMSVADFVNVVAASGVPVNQSIASNVQANRWVSDKSQTFRIESVGQVGEVEKKITAVVRLDANLGRLLYWRED